MKFTVFIALVTLVPSSALADKMYMVSKQIRVEIFGEFDDAPYSRGTVLSGECYPLKSDEGGFVVLKFGNGIFGVAKEDCTVVSPKDTDAAIANYRKNTQDNKATVVGLAKRNEIGQKIALDREHLEPVWNNSDTPLLHYYDIVRQMQVGKISKLDGLLQIEKEFSAAISKIKTAKAAMADDDSVKMASAALASLTGIRDLVKDVSDFNKQQKSGARMAVGKAAVSAAVGNAGGALEALGHQFIDEGADLDSLVDKHGKVDHLENLRQTSLQLYRLLGKRIPSCILTSEEEEKGGLQLERHRLIHSSGQRSNRLSALSFCIETSRPRRSSRPP